VLVDDIMRKQHIWQWRIAFENCRTDVHDCDHTGQHITSETHYSRNGGPILDYHRVAVSEFSAALQLSIETVVEWL